MKIGIIALGWLGESLYDYWQGKYELVGTYFSCPKNKKNEIYFDWSKNQVPTILQDCDVIVLNLTPSTIQNENKLQSFLEQIKARVVFISSTSVYGNQGLVDEMTKPNPIEASGKLLQNFEDLVLHHRLDNLVIRPAGLYGKNRHPGKFLAGRKLSYNGESAVNLIGLSDLISIVDQALLQDEIRIINAVNINHPSKRQYYNDYCNRNGLELPYWSDYQQEEKTINTCYPKFKITSLLP